MAVFSYSAIDRVETIANGTLIAGSPVEGRQQLRARGLRILEFGEAKLTRRWAVSLGGSQRRQEEVAEVARYLSLLLRAGVPLAEAMDILTRKRKGKFITVLKDIRDRLQGGESLGDALAHHDRWFDKMFVSSVRVGELTGNLDESLTELAEHLRAKQSLRRQFAGALTYPLILVCIGVAVVVFLMSFVIPQLLAVLVASGRPLPASTMLLKGVSDFGVAYWPMLVLGLIVLIGMAASLYRTTSGKRWVHRAGLRVPVLGSLVRKSVIAEFAQQMAVMLRTGIPFVEAVKSVGEMTRHVVLAEELTAMAHAVESGSDIAPCMEESRIFPPVVVHLVAVGQSSGELTEMLSELRTRYETEVGLAISRFTTALEPLLIVVLAAVVGFVVFACLMPILEATRGIA